MAGRDVESDESRVLLADAAGWRLLSLLFHRPVPGWTQQMEALAREVGDRALSQAVDLAGDVDEGEYLSFLGPGGIVSPRETAHQPLQDPGQLLADLSGFYKAFLYVPNGEDPPDHMATEVGFVAFLRLKDTYAHRAGQKTEAWITRDALARFLEDHLSPFVESFHAGIAAAGAPPYVVEAATLVRQRIHALQSLVEIN